LEEITDLAGIRVITYFSEDVDRVASVIEREFNIDPENSIDKRAALDPDRFGYLSLHYVASVAEHRIALPEYARLRTLKFEIQVRSILQHSWAEIEHDLGYKSKAGVPREIQRRFARVASLLELADTEFEGIRSELAAYAAAVPAAIRLSPDEVTVDKLSLGSYTNLSVTAHHLDQLSAEHMGAQIIDADDGFLDRLASRLQWLGIDTIADLEAQAAEYIPLGERFIPLFVREGTGGELRRGIGIAHMLYVIAVKRGKEVLRTYLDRFSIETPPKREQFIKRVIDAYEGALVLECDA
jgi:putative GTP pyrophosphokinase